MLEYLVSLIRSEDPSSSLHDIDLIVPLSYATLPDKLTNGSYASIMIALRYKTVFPQAALIFSNPTHSGFAECNIREFELKKRILRNTPYVCAETCVNSVTEAEAIRAALNFAPKRILIICGEAHSPSVRLIWQYVFPGAAIIIRCMPYAYEYQPDNPFPVARRAWPWFFVSMVRYMLLLVVGPAKMRKLKHKAE